MYNKWGKTRINKCLYGSFKGENKWLSKKTRKQVHAASVVCQSTCMKARMLRPQTKVCGTATIGAKSIKNGLWSSKKSLELSHSAVGGTTNVSQDLLLGILGCYHISGSMVYCPNFMHLLRCLWKQIKLVWSIKFHCLTFHRLSVWCAALRPLSLTAFCLTVISVFAQKCATKHTRRNGVDKCKWCGKEIAPFIIRRYENGEQYHESCYKEREQLRKHTGRLYDHKPEGEVHDSAL